MQIPAINTLNTNKTDLSQAVRNSSGTNSTQNASKTFSDILNSLTESQNYADSLTNDLASGGNTDIASVMIASEENDVNMRVSLAIRDKLVDAYHEIMRMSI
jgi:flagellar hook-basal body complex protein FliE